MYRSVWGQPCGTHSMEGSDAMGKQSRVNRQCSDDWENWTRFEQAEDKGLTASLPLYFDI